MSSGLDSNKNVNSQINLIFVGVFHPKCYSHWNHIYRFDGFAAI